MSKRWWLLGVVGLVSVALLLACGSKYSSSSDGLLLVGSQGSNVIQTFSFNLNNGHAAGISSPPATSGSPFGIVVDPAGSYAYVLLDRTSIGIYKVGSGGSLTSSGNSVSFTQPTVTIAGSTTTEQVPVVPSEMIIDSTGKYLFVADRATTDPSQNAVPGAISVFSIGGGSLTEVAGSPFFVTAPVTTLPSSAYDFVSVAPSPTVFPQVGINGTQNSVCTVGNNPPTSEYLYAVDAIGNQVFEFQVDSTSGALTFPSLHSSFPSVAVGATPSGIAVDPCARFVYVTSLAPSNNINAFSVCNAAITGVCTAADGTLNKVSGSPFALSGSANGPGPIVVDPFGNNLYVVGTLSNTVSGFRIASVTGSLTPQTPATTATGSGPTSIAIRGDDNWMFVTNFNSASVSQYSITPATGAVNAGSPITTDNNPWGIAVK